MFILLALLLAGPQNVLWRDPGRVELIDFMRPAGYGTCPVPPFTFMEEGLDGTSPKVLVRDATGDVWQVKGGPEARADAFSTRFVAALGYYADTICFIASGEIYGIGQQLKRAGGFINPDGTFSWASFELRESKLRFLPNQSWTWTNNPFKRSRELKGLEVLVMLLSNWDNKDARNNWQGTNTGILETNGEPRKRIYYVTDWGQTLGRWSGLRLGKPWDCAAFTEQTPEFIKGVHSGFVAFGFRGQHTSDFSHAIKVADTRWLMRYLGRITDSQIRVGLLASGATPAEEECFAVALRNRIEQLRHVAANDR